MRKIIFLLALMLCVSSCAQRLGPQAQQWSAAVPSDLYQTIHPGQPIEAQINIIDVDTLHIPLYCAPCTLSKETNSEFAAADDRKVLGNHYDCAVLQGPWCQGYIDVSYIDENGLSRRLTVPALLYPGAHDIISVTLKDVRDDPDTEDVAVFVQTGRR